MIREQEVTITEPETADDDPMGNPARFFTLYSRDYKYRYVKQTTVNELAYHEIDLFPNNLNQPYSRIKVFVGVKSEMPGIISSIGKDGIDYTFFLKNYVLDKEVADLSFSFDPAKNKKTEVVDMRGVR
jgi:outer membrane lipoprotein-sorting protein